MREEGRKERREGEREGRKTRIWHGLLASAIIFILLDCMQISIDRIRDMIYIFKNIEYLKNNTKNYIWLNRFLVLCHTVRFIQNNKACSLLARVSC